MRRIPDLRTCAALASACAFPACSTADIDETDHGAFFVDARVRKSFATEENQGGPFVAEAGWTLLDGSTGPLEYTIQTVNLGAQVVLPVDEGEDVWIGLGGGFMGRFSDLDTNA